MKRILIIFVFFLTGIQPGFSQRVYLGSPTNSLLQSDFGILSNSVANLHAVEGAVWVGPFLNYSNDQGTTWFLAESDSLFGSVNRLFSIDVDNSVIVAGLGRNDRTGGQNIQTAAGFLISEDAGQTFTYRFPQLDSPSADTEEYGVSILPALPVIVPQQSPPFDIDYSPQSGDIWVAGWASGIRRSSDMGRTWSRVVLPPDNLDFITPEIEYSFSVEPQRGGTGSLNHMGFSILIDETGTVWAGTAGGLNRSVDGGQAWQRFKADGSSETLTGNWIISIEEQHTTGAPVIWIASWNTGDVGGGASGTFGVTYTRDEGASFHQTLLGERIYDFAFDGLRVYAAGDNGLFISDDGGRVWDSVSRFVDAGSSGRLVRPDARVFSVEVTDGVLWVGTTDGLLKSLDRGRTWTIFHVNVPLHPDEATASVPNVDTYAYPNPFSKSDDSFIRIKYELTSSRVVNIRIFDFGMNVVRELTVDAFSGVNESRWDGTDDNGVRVPNGAYFYEIRAGSNRFRGKILVIE